VTSDIAAWQRSILPADATIRDAVLNLNDVAIRIALVLDDDGRMLGTISDGDIRRGLLRGLTLDNPVTEILHRNPLVAPATMGRDMISLLMLANKMQQIPVVDEDNHVVGLHLWDELESPPARTNTLVIMSGGKGVRLRPHTENCPKPMLLVAGRPMLEHIIERARLEGFQRFVLAVHYLGHMIEDHFEDGSRFGVTIDYLHEKHPLGTAGALSLMARRPGEAMVITNGDVLTDIRYGEFLDFHLRHQATATMAVRIHEWQHPFGVVQTRGIDIVGFEEKPITRTHINAGVYALDPLALDLLKPGEPCDMPTLFEMLQARAVRIVAYPMHEPWLDVGRPEDLHLARTMMPPAVEPS
jgi:dTDP-glucose pyrophosphorylase